MSYLDYIKKNYIYLSLIIIFVVVLVFIVYLNINKSDKFLIYNANKERDNNNESNEIKKAELILFYVDWCPHCKTAKPEWDEFKNEYNGKTINGYKLVFSEYNCTNENGDINQLINKYNIEGYPTIKLIKDNQVIEYDAKPAKATMEVFINNML